MEELVQQDAKRQQERSKGRKKKSKKQKKERKKDHKKRGRREGKQDDLPQRDRLLEVPDGIKSKKKRKLCEASGPVVATNGKKDETPASSALLAEASPSRPLHLHPCTPPSNSKQLFPYKFVLAPMVGASELAFRLLCRRYGAGLCYTPMMDARRFASDPAYRAAEFQTCPSDRPLVCHFSANRPEDFADAVRAAAPHCDAVDLNLGCPQRTAYVGHFGSYLLDKEDRDLVCQIVRAGVDATGNALPICCKIRLLDTVDETIELCRQLEGAGASWIAIHARYRATWERQGPGARDGPALLDQVAEIKRHVGIPLIANGNVTTFRDVEANLQFTGADAIMSAEGILDNPALYLPRWGARHGASKQMVAVPNLATSGPPSSGAADSSDDATRAKSRRKLQKRLREIRRLEERCDSLTKEERDKVAKKECLLSSLRKLEADIVDTKPGPTDTQPEPSTTTQVSLEELYQAADCALKLALEYLNLVRKFPVKIRSVVFHVRRMLKEDLLKYQLLEDLLGCEQVGDVQGILKKIEQYRTRPESFVFDQAKAMEQKEAIERKKQEEGKRKAYEARMMRKAKREGKDPNFYLSLGAAVPTTEEVGRFRSMKREVALEAWKADHSQHCLSYHLDPKGCKRGRSCAFLHVDANNFVEGDEVAG